MNRLRLQASLIERSALRYTPAGMPITEARLRHEGKAIEAGIERNITFEFAAIAAGSVAERLGRQALGSTIEIDGFLATTSQRSQRLRVHITDYTQVSEI